MESLPRSKPLFQIASMPGTAGMSNEQLLVILADTINTLRKRAASDIIEIGQRLIEAKAIAGHGNWLPWLEKEFGWTDQTARNYMQVYECAKSQNFLNLDLPVSALYLLAAPSTPPEAVETVINRAKAGEKVTGEVKKVVQEAKSKSSPRPPGSGTKK